MGKVVIAAEIESEIPSKLVECVNQLRKELVKANCRCSESLPPLLCLCNDVLIKALLARNLSRDFRTTGLSSYISILITLDSSNNRELFAASDLVSSILRGMGAKVTIVE